MCATGWRVGGGMGPVSFHNYVIGTTRWQSSLDVIRVELKTITGGKRWGKGKQ